MDVYDCTSSEVLVELWKDKQIIKTKEETNMAEIRETDRCNESDNKNHSQVTT